MSACARCRWLLLSLSLVGGAPACREQPVSRLGQEGARSSPIQPLSDASPEPGVSSGACAGGVCLAAASAAESSCVRAEILRPPESSQRASFSRRGSTNGAPAADHAGLGNCRGTSPGPEVWYQLDLQAVSRPLEFRAVLNGDFDGLLELRRGACGDTLALDCDRASALGKPGSTLAGRLDPGVYWLVVGGAASPGDFALEIELDPELGECQSPAPNRSCEAALPLEPQAFQTLLLELSCAPPAAGESSTTLYYEIDLSREPAALLASASLWSLRDERFFPQLRWYREEADGSSCTSELANSYVSAGKAFRVAAEASALLVPGRYVLAAEIDPTPLEDERLQLSLRLDRESCSGGASANRCADALELDATAAVQLRAGSTLCNADLFAADCSEGAPEQLWRLDLRGAAGATRARAAILADGTDFTPVLYLLNGSDSGACGELLYCPDTFGLAEGLPLFDLTLQPDLYFLGVDGWEVGNAGHYRLLLELSAVAARPCIDATIAACAFDEYAIDCCYDSGARCDRVLALCGLAPATRACVCAANPACCGPDRRDASCAASYQACQYLCPEFAPAESACY